MRLRDGAKAWEYETWYMERDVPVAELRSRQVEEMSRSAGEGQS